MGLAFGLVYCIAASAFLYWAWNKFCEMTEDHEVEVRKEEIIKGNVKFNEINRFRESHDTSDKSKHITDFIQGEN